MRYLGKSNSACRTNLTNFHTPLPRYNMGSCPISHLFLPMSHQNFRSMFCHFQHLFHISSGNFFIPNSGPFSCMIYSPIWHLFWHITFTWKLKVVIVRYVNGLPYPYQTKPINQNVSELRVEHNGFVILYCWKTFQNCVNFSFIT